MSAAAEELELDEELLEELLDEGWSCWMTNCQWGAATGCQRHADKTGADELRHSCVQKGS